MTSIKIKKKSFRELLIALFVLGSVSLLIACGNQGNAAPVIYGISPSVGVETLVSTTTSGTPACTFTSPGAVTLNGANFGSTQGTGLVLVNNYNAGPAVSWQDNNIVFNAPADATPQPTDPNVFWTSNGYYNITIPVTVTVNYVTSNAVTFTYSVTCTSSS